MDLLLLHDENAHHYVLILNLERFVAYFKGIAHRAAQRICRNCFLLCTNRETYQNHVKTCSEHAAAEIVMPKESNTSLQFRNWKARWFLPIVLYFDLSYLESYLVPIYTLNLILFQSLQHNPHPLLPTQLQLKNMNLVVMQ